MNGTAYAPPLTHSAVEYVRDSLTLLFLGQPDMTRRYLAVYGAFWDASGTQESDPWLTVAGFVSTADRWVEFTAEWQAELERLDVPGRIFHANQLNSTKTPEYADWNWERRKECSTALVDVILRHAVGSVAITVPAPTIRRAIPLALKGKVGHPYAIASHLCIVEASGLLQGSLKLRDVTLNHWFAAGDDGFGELMTVRDYELMRPKRVEHLAIGSLTFGAQAAFPPLQAADFLAWELTRYKQRQDDPSAPIRTSLDRFRTLPRRWRYVTEDGVGDQMLIVDLIGTSQVEARPVHWGMSWTEWNRLRDKLDQQSWTKADVRRLQERVRRIQKASL